MEQKQITPAEAEELRAQVVQATVDRDVAVRVAVEAKSNETEAREDAKEQHEQALSAQAETIQASAREAVARQDASEQREELRSAHADTAIASGREAVAREDAREQQAVSLNAQADLTWASEEVAVARQDAKEQHADAVSAQTEAATMTTLRHIANDRADAEESSGNRARSALLIIASVLITALIIMVVWLYSR